MASSLNKAMVIGNLTRDPELRQTGSGQSVCSFGVATNRSWTNSSSGEKQEQVEYHNIVAWGKLAEICNQYLKKGNKVFIEGRLQTRDWEGQDGVKRYRTEIITENMVMLGGKAGSGSGTGFGGDSYSQPEPRQDEPSVSPDDEIKIEDIPF
ncbi:single-stranded DNA-binding protein [Candidatus Uhrbacteria bacterium CG_4_9_14_0_2_um_filter_41_50]|uniref:Single-stranded DNA-binding protein n=1 Tax=Candidatus Uhrbacteria bacterium CG_4_9_14_0_2_um_filter_41_50 TaxID=1975031 RepID=A0A2M8EN65_9BACT|nr:MAG: single-stranded DNA-binding protein [Candidatus Uhrbacteria bacterium CG_4_10_14_3_um_filter_41_21]PIZ55150.1 MAG: single-stranded DNA-binding protein [Candidatus Uhrbacteria bacterium CG_4_10_14_0_2_um_filter_41_21]PJB84857.1 MAG: single-stranded DNA-binding protein [Candidatus Uhrbacteria bacterium CG_4_9_14_0_8_um_filter_41_16]PJC24117.1 MAG: single-stranded DNA-binding protein [Candidatus Uhrbacteria bacterium CG_4_9_14_0_2_um_filter_41_50]PJE75006.1 MAG: single-stranded DNA-binding